MQVDFVQQRPQIGMKRDRDHDVEMGHQPKRQCVHPIEALAQPLIGRKRTADEFPQQINKRVCLAPPMGDAMDVDEETLAAAPNDVVIPGVACLTIWYPENFRVVNQR
ncbi:MAG: hypothetical protein KDK78_03880 [Chlamydiia bacterium]|nr:hypothetical protein [Chlamydiia bacterium]